VLTDEPAAVPLGPWPLLPPPITAVQWTAPSSSQAQCNG
jgi:hypothetical protein